MNIRKILSTVLVIIWMWTIFCFSHQQGIGSSSMSKKVSMIIVNVFDIKNEMSQEEKQEFAVVIEPVIRKLAHCIIYMLGGILIVNCTYAYGIKDKKAVTYGGIIGVIYAVSDEIHQLFVNGRSGKIVDILIDSIGVFMGIAIYLLIKKIVDRLQKE